MSLLRSLMMGVLAFLVSGIASAEEKKADKADYAKLIIGTWETTKDSKNGFPKGQRIEFTKDGKVKINLKVNGKEIMAEAAYALKGNQLGMTIKDLSGKEITKTFTIDRLDDKELAITEEEKATDVMKRVTK